MRTLTTYFGLMVLLLALMSCSSSKQNYNIQPRVINTTKAVRVSTIVEQRSAGELLRLQTIMLSQFKTKVRYKVEWFNDSGVMLNTILSNWKVKAMLPKKPYSISFIAPNEDAVTYKIFIEKI